MDVGIHDLRVIPANREAGKLDTSVAIQATPRAPDTLSSAIPPKEGPVWEPLNGQGVRHRTLEGPGVLRWMSIPMVFPQINRLADREPY